jgi:hypothetical protein
MKPTEIKIIKQAKKLFKPFWNENVNVTPASALRIRADMIEFFNLVKEEYMYKLQNKEKVEISDEFLTELIKVVPQTYRVHIFIGLVNGVSKTLELI